MSDSDYESEDEQAGFSTVLLGFAGKEALQTDLSLQGNHIGGTPLWLGDRPPSAELLTCKVCGKRLDLLAQLNCPLPDSYYDRILYVLACSESKCWRKPGSVRSIRGVESNEKVRRRIEQELESSQPENSLFSQQGSLGDALFASTNEGGTNPFDQPASCQSMFINDHSAEKKSSKSKKKAKSKKDLHIAEGKYICKLLEVEEEYIEQQDPQKQLKGIRIEELDTEPTAEKASSSKDTAVLSEIEQRTDAAFTHFVDVVENNPEQVLRYERGLRPLLYSATDGVPEKLKQLTSKVLELQLMPHLISELETDDMIADGMEWGTIFVATDENDKLPELDDAGIGYTEEWVEVQWE